MRGILKALLLLTVLLAAAVVTLPWWLGTALRPLARAQGATFERYETVGYARFRLEGVKLARPGLAFSAARATLDTPLLWLLRRARAHAEISDWSLRLVPTDGPRPGPPKPTSPAAVHAQVRRGWHALQRWLPRVTAENGTLARGNQTWRITRATWSDDTLRADGQLPSGQDLHVSFTEERDALVATAELPSFAARTSLTWTARALRGTGTWQEQPFSLEARFDDPAWIPTRAEFRAADWDLAAAPLKLGPAYDRVRGHLLARWTGGAFTVDLEAAATPLASRHAPPFEIAAHAEGNRWQIVLRTLQVRAPFATATLSAPLTISLETRAAIEPAVLAIAADLSRQPWFDAAGKLTGEIRALPRGTASRGTFTGAVEALRWRKLVAQSGRIRGAWEGTRVQFDEVNVTLDAESRIIARGAIDGAPRTIDSLRVDATLTPGWAAPLLPPGLAFERVVAAVELDGPLAAPRHRGELNVTQLRAQQLRPLDLHAQWTGEAAALSDVALSARVPHATLQLAGAVAGPRATVREFKLERDGRALLHSVAPAEFVGKPHWQISGLRLEGDDRALAVDAAGGDAPRFFVSAHNLTSEWLSDWWTGEIVPLRIATLSLHASQQGHVLLGEMTLEASAQVDGTWLQGRLAANAQSDGIRISQLELADPRGLMAYATGRVPVRLAWSTGPRLDVDQTAPLELDASIAPDSPLWEIVRRQAQLTVEGGSIVASLAGSLAQPRGLVRLDATRIARHAAAALENDPAAITAFAATLRGQRDGLQLEALTAQVAGHALRATGRLPMNDDAWRTLLRAPREFDWRRAEVQLSAPHVELAALAHTFPALPFTGGTLAAEMQFAGGELTGRAELRGGASRPLPGVGRLLAIEADLALAGRKLEFRTFSARLGGEPVELTGTAALGDRRRLDLDLRLQAKNVPLVRRPGLLVRTDLDLRAQTPERGPTRISGRVDLRDALVLADLAAILPGGPRGASRAPPYFSVVADPFARWPLDVQIGGLRAVRVRTAVFNGIATPQFHLTGTLGEPRAIGQLSVDEGQVLFPFARFAVQQGTVRLTAADPAQPQLAVNATAKRMGYELRLEAGGTTASPTLAFSSNPPLESADILLLVTTGQPPKDDTTAGPTNQQRLTRLGTFLGSGIFQNFGGTEDRLEITSGEQVSEAGRETYRAEYKLTDKLSLTGEYDQYDDYNAGVSYRIYTKEGAKREEPKK